ncbi:hypothetical protein ACFX1R_004349 [Malus domestica]
MNCLQTTPHWEEFTKAFCTEFGLFKFEDCAQSLFKLRHTGHLKDYISEFRRLANRTYDVGPILLKSCFLGGLKKELQFDVKILRLTTVHEAIVLAVQLDTKLSELHVGNLRPLPQIKSQGVVPFVPASPTTKFGNIHVKKLSLEEIAKKRERGEYWFCVEKWSKGHKCGQKQLLMLDFVEPEEEFEDARSELQPEFQNMELSECAFYGTNLPQKTQTMKVEGLVGKHSMRMLLDSGSTHSFIDFQLTKHMGWTLQPTQPCNVIIANGGNVCSQGCLKATSLVLGGYHWSHDSYDLPLGGCDLVLGVDWLSIISHVLWDFHLLTMEF